MAYVDLTKAYGKFNPQGGGFNFEENKRRREARLAQEQASQQTFPIEEPPATKQSFTERLRSLVNGVASVTGGNKIAQGLGQGLAMGSTKTTLDSIQAGEGEMQQKLIQAIRNNKAIGKDTSRLEASLKALTGGIEQTGAGAEDLYNPNKLTTKQVIGDALQLGTTVVGVGSLPGVAKKTASAVGIKAGVIQGAKSGAKAGAVYGGVSGVAQGLKQDKNAVDIAKQGLGGVVGGAVTGGLLGGAVGGVSGGLKARAVKQATKDSDFLTDLVAPKATDKVKIQALNEGRVTEQGLLKASKILPSKRDIQLAEAVKDVVSPKLSPAQNLNAIKAKVDDINTGVKAYVQVNKTPFNSNQLRTQLNKGKDELDVVFASDKQAEKTYDAVVKVFMNRIKSKDTAGLFQVRQEFDNIPAIKKLLDSQGLGENTKREVSLTVRSMANKYIASLLPKGNQFRETLLRESKMIEAMGNLAEKNSNTIGLNRLQVWDKKYPILRWFVGGAVGAGGVGVGSTIIGSSD